MFNRGDKVRFINKTVGSTVEEIKRIYGVDIIHECFGVIEDILLDDSCGCYILDNVSKKGVPRISRRAFNFTDLIPCKEINYDSLVEIEE